MNWLSDALGWVCIGLIGCILYMAGVGAGLVQ